VSGNSITNPLRDKIAGKLIRDIYGAVPKITPYITIKPALSVVNPLVDKFFAGPTRMRHPRNFLENYDHWPIDGY